MSTHSAEFGFGEGGADDVDPVEPGLFLDPGLPALDGWHR
jgi:hypothetical protein